MSPGCFRRRSEELHDVPERSVLLQTHQQTGGRTAKLLALSSLLCAISPVATLGIPGETRHQVGRTCTWRIKRPLVLQLVPFPTRSSGHHPGRLLFPAAAFGFTFRQAPVWKRAAQNRQSAASPALSAGTFASSFFTRLTSPSQSWKSLFDMTSATLVSDQGAGVRWGGASTSRYVIHLSVSEGSCQLRVHVV